MVSVSQKTARTKVLLKDEEQMRAATVKVTHCGGSQRHTSQDILLSLLLSPSSRVGLSHP